MGKEMLSVMHAQSCFAYKTYLFLTFSLLSVSLDLKVAIYIPQITVELLASLCLTYQQIIYLCLIETTERAWSWIRKGQNKWTWPQRTRSEEHQTQAWVWRWKHPILSCSTQAWVQKYVSKVEIPLLIYLLKSFSKRPGTLKSKLQYEVQF